MSADPTNPQAVYCLRVTFHRVNLDLALTAALKSPDVAKEAAARAYELAVAAGRPDLAYDAIIVMAALDGRTLHSLGGGAA